MWQWWTLQYGCYCHTLICRVSNCCLSLYLHVAAAVYNRVLEDTFGVLESPGIYLGQDSGSPVLCRYNSTLQIVAVVVALYSCSRSCCYSLLCVCANSWSYRCTTQQCRRCVRWLGPFWAPRMRSRNRLGSFSSQSRSCWRLDMSWNAPTSTDITSNRLDTRNRSLSSCRCQ